MPNTGLINDQYALPSYSNVFLTAQVAVAPVNTFVDVMTFGTLPAGTYQISAAILIKQITNATVVTWKFLDGAAIIAAGEFSVIAASASSLSIPDFIVNHLASGIIKLQVATTVVTTTVEKLAANNGTGTDNFVSYMNAVRIG